jgi:hypothetical protein
VLNLIRVEFVKAKMLMSSSIVTRYMNRGFAREMAYPFVFAAFLGFPTEDATAFSLDTHLYIATKVLDDALTGSISVCAGEALASAKPGSRCARRYHIPSATLDALKGKPSAYLAGALGPDVFPDFITSQVTVHPGLEHGWGTDDFLRHLQANVGGDDDLAWVNGFLSHASSDVFAHSWVNHYAGGIFDISKHIENNEIEVRHFVLERYIADRTPRNWSKYAATPEAPHEFVADQLMLANPVSAQFKKAGAVTGHVVAIEVLHENVQKLYEDALALSKTINDIGAKKLQPLETAKAQLKLAEEGLKLAGKGLEEAEKALKWRDDRIAEAEKALLDAAKIIDENPGLITGWRQQMEAAKLSLDAQESGLEGLRDAVRGARKLVDEAQKVLDATGETICKNLPRPLDALCDINPAYTSAKTALNAAKEALAAKEKVLNEALNGIASLKKLREDLDRKVAEAEKAIADARIVQQTVGAQLKLHRAQRKLESDSVKTARKGVEDATKVAQQLLDKVSEDLAPVVDLLARYNPIVLFLQHWAADIRRASIAFSKSSQGVAEHLLAKKDGNALEPYVKWYECWSPVLGAVPSEVPQTVCTAKNIYTDLHDKLTEEINKVVDSLGSLGWLIAPNVKVQQEFEKKVKKPLEKEVKKAVGHVAGEVVAFLSNRQLANLIELIASKDRITDARLNGIYETDDSKSRLLEIEDVAALVRRDAGLGADGDMVSEDRFPALHNAIVLSKLALLDADTLNAVYNDLAIEANPQAEPRKLFAATPGQPFNILLRAVSSIDGNHQWQAIGLPYPVSSGSMKGWPDKSRFGRPGYAGAHSGFLFWGDLRAREIVFKQLFRGPLSPGMEAYPAIVASYPFPSCERHPFPSTTRPDGSRADDDYTCRLMSGGQEKRGNYPALSERVVKPRELAQLGLWELRIARNEIFARHGYRFGPDELVNHFGGQSWYQPSDLPVPKIVENLSRTEWRNISRIRQAELRMQRR